MHKNKIIRLFLLATCYSLLATNIFAQEEITITTYYPSPYGSYNDLGTNKLAVDTANVAVPSEYAAMQNGDVHIGRSLIVGAGGGSGFAYDELTGPPDDRPADGNVLIKGRVGIGTAIPNAALQVNGAISRQGTVFYGDAGTIATHVNLGVNSITGDSGGNYSYATIGGGYNNKAWTGCIVGGGENNSAEGGWSNIGGGKDNRTYTSYAAIGGGRSNYARGVYGTIGGGYDNSEYGWYSVVGGGQNNQSGDDFAYYNTIGGGYDNSTVGNAATIAGGMSNKIMVTVPSGGADKTYGVTIAGGVGNIAGSIYSMVAGGAYNEARERFSFAAGRRAKAVNQGSFVWADSQNADYNANGDNTFNIRASGGVYYAADKHEALWDIAEEMDVLKKDNIKPAELVSLGRNDTLIKTSQEYDDNLIGVVTSKRTTTLHLQSLAPAKENTEKRFISLVGRVYVKVNNQNGPIKIGDPITSSSVFGIGMKASRTCKIIGYAMQEEDFKDGKEKEVLVFVNVGHYIPKQEFAEIAVLKEKYNELSLELKSLKEKLFLKKEDKE